MDDTENTTETVATFIDDLKTYDIDHLGISHPEQWGEFAIYRGGVQVGDFTIPGAMLRPEYRPAELPPAEELIDLARARLLQLAPQD